MPAAIVGRDQELAAVEAFLDEVEHGPAALVLSGEAGIGKTILWEAGVEQARERFGSVLTHRSVEAEASLAFGGLSDLLEPVLDEVAPALVPPRRQALEVALWLAEPGGEPPDPAAIGLAFLDVLRLLAERGPVLVALDDLQWLDSSTALVVPLALRRLRDERVGFLATLRKAPEATSPFELERSFTEERLRSLALGPLSLGALHHLLRQRLALELNRPELSRVLETSGGNPFFTIEIGRDLKREGAKPELGKPLPAPASLGKLLGVRLARLSPETRDVLLVAAAAGRPTIEVITAAHGEPDRALEELDRAVWEGLLELDNSRVRFAHPLLASVLYDRSPPGRRRAVHRALAGVVSEVEERARHQALAAEGPDAVVSSDLGAAADQAAARGAPAAAAELAELAAELTPDDPALARQHRFRAATCYRLAGNGERAVELLESLLSEVPHGTERADVLFELALTLRADTPTLVKLCDEALAEAAGDDARSARILAYRGQPHVWETDVRAALTDARAALEKAERVGAPGLLAVAIARVGHAETCAADVTPGLLERGARLEDELGLQLEFIESPRVVLARQLMYLADLDRPRDMLEALEEEFAARGDEESRVLVTWVLGMLEWLAGRWQPALDRATAAQELAEQTQNPHSRAWMGRVKALVEVDLGLVDAARTTAEEAIRLSEASSNQPYTVFSLGTLGRLELALGNLEAAGGYLRELPARLLAGGLNDPTTPVWADAIETLIALGELDQAREYLVAYEANAHRLGSPWAVAAALRCRGLFAAAERDLEAASGALEGALAALKGSPYPLEQGRTLLCAGTVRRQAQRKRAAREALDEALAIFEELGARLWADKARGELARISGPRPASDELTETELRVATLAAQGRSNRQIASELYMGVSTVEAHLSRVYRKLGVRRAELALLVSPRIDPATLRGESGHD